MLSPSRKAVMSFAIVVSIFGLVFTSVVMLFRPITIDFIPFRKPLTGVAFASICFLGILAIFFPSECSTGIHASKTGVEPKAMTPEPDSYIRLRNKGHHPDCRNYEDHIIVLGSLYLCAACTGLLAGAVIALSGAFLYFFLNLGVRGIGFHLVLLGQIGIIVGLLQFKFKHYIRVLVNCYFVVAALFILVGVDDVLGSTFIDLYYVFLILFWLLTRILISGWDHQRICRRCPDHCNLSAALTA